MSNYCYWKVFDKGADVYVGRDYHSEDAAKAFCDSLIKDFGDHFVVDYIEEEKNTEQSMSANDLLKRLLEMKDNGCDMTKTVVFVNEENEHIPLQGTTIVHIYNGEDYLEVF